MVGNEAAAEDLNNELNELAGLDGSNAMAGGMDAAKEYVEPSQHDMRRSKQVNADMANKLEKQAEENKTGGGKRPSRPSLRGGAQQSFLLQSFAPMKPIVVTKEFGVQTEGEPLKIYATSDTQTDVVEMVSTRMQTENADTKDGSVQTVKAKIFETAM